MTISLSDPFSEEKLKAQEALYSVIDPELFVNVIDLGLIYDVAFDGDNIVVTMTLSTPHCPMGEAITNGVQNALEKVFPGKEIRIDLTFDPPWGFEMLTQEGRMQLGLK
ncbi:metal-sulfur cluster assembly factor [Parafilimonas terrae]|uniref:Metal-sulfur cluster biosynthetic enzyme n=1 Tax=Parafilimonas terrae TaxID=1465490 RepID=A0A1I5TSS1_9BACT|nr:metal-sulfur cluster assembly factor [Parafilimonas terrae]SFP86112.1 Metal-sulfur cluster biosynthetic enzyme [Parafilimonas terrae]